MVASTALVVVAIGSAARAAWPQHQGDATHAGVVDGPSAPLSIAWDRSGIELEGPNTNGGLSAPVIADDGTIVVVAPTAVLGLSPSDGSQTFSAERDFGPSSQPAVGQGADGPIVVYTEGFGGSPPTGTASPSPTGGDEDEDGGGFDSHVSAIELGTGRPAWDAPVQLEEVVQTPVTVDDDTAYVGDVGGGVTAVDLASGDVRWTADVGSPVSGAVTLEGDRVLVSTLGEQRTPGVIVALDASTGDEVWTSGDDAVLGNLVSSPVVADGRIFALEPGAIVALDDEGAGRWRSEVVNPRTTPFIPRGTAAPAPVSAGGQVIAVDATGRVYAFDAETGAELWDHALNDASSLSPPVLTEEHVLVPSDAGILYAVDRSTGHLASRVDTGFPLLRGLADAGETLIGVARLGDAAVLAFAADPGAALTDEPSPTTVDVGRMLAGFALGGLGVGIVALLLARPLQRRFGPALPRAAGDGEAEA
jgi:outer membrane protein assembly factor BamB